MEVSNNFYFLSWQHPWDNTTPLCTKYFFGFFFIHLNDSISTNTNSKESWRQWSTQIVYCLDPFHLVLHCLFFLDFFNSFNLAAFASTQELASCSKFLPLTAIFTVEVVVSLIRWEICLIVIHNLPNSPERLRRNPVSIRTTFPFVCFTDICPPGSSATITCVWSNKDLLGIIVRTFLAITDSFWDWWGHAEEISFSSLYCMCNKFIMTLYYKLRFDLLST